MSLAKAYLVHVDAKAACVNLAGKGERRKSQGEKAAQN